MFLDLVWLVGVLNDNCSNLSRGFVLPGDCKTHTFSMTEDMQSHPCLKQGRSPCFFLNILSHYIENQWALYISPQKYS